MAYKLEMNDPTFPADTEFDVGGVTVPNGGSVEVSENDERNLIAKHGASVKDALGNHPYLKVTGSSALPKGEQPKVETPVEEGGEV